MRSRVRRWRPPSASRACPAPGFEAALPGGGALPRLCRRGVDALRVTWPEVGTAKPDGKVTCRNGFVAEIAACGRARRRIGNSTSNVPRTNGYDPGTISDAAARARTACRWCSSTCARPPPNGPPLTDRPHRRARHRRSPVQWRLRTSKTTPADRNGAPNRQYTAHNGICRAPPDFAPNRRRSGI